MFTVKGIFLQTIIQRLKDQYLQTWTGNIAKNHKLILYRGFKNSFSTEAYLDFVKIRKYRRVLCTTSSHWLEIERGRYEGVARNDRKCKYCNNFIEDEFHFICICPLYDNIRTYHLSNTSNQNISLITFNNLLSSNDIHTVRNLSLFIYHAFKMRQHFLNTL